MTGSGPDTTAPLVTTAEPTNGASGVAINDAISAEFSEDMDPATLSTSSMTLLDASSNPVTGTVSYNPNDREVTFYPGTSLASSNLHTARISTVATDLAGNPLAVAYAWTFTTGAAPDTVPPQVASTNPAASATLVSRSAPISAVFTEPLDPASVSLTTVLLRDAVGNAVSGIITYDETSKTVTFTPDAELLPILSYSAELTTGIRDLAGNTLPSSFSWSFSTGAL